MRALLTARRRHLLAGAARRALAIAFGCSLAVIVVELLLRLAPFELPLALDNYVRSCYEADRSRSSIGFFSPLPGVRLHKPHFETECVFNRLGWSHRTDQLGNRNPEDWPNADVLLLGDSMVYGHGVEERETFASHLRSETGRRVINAGQTDTSVVEHLVKVQSFAPLLRPKAVVVFLYRNDLVDIRRARTADQVERLVDGGDAPEARAYTAAELFEHAEPLGLRAVLLDHLLVARVVRYQFRGESDRFAVLRQQSPEARTTSRLALDYQRSALLRMRDASHAVRARLVLGYMPTSRIPNAKAERRGEYTRREAQALAAALRLPFFDPSAAFVGADGHSDPAAFLQGDWHLSAEGHRRMARALSEFLRRERVLD